MRKVLKWGMLLLLFWSVNFFLLLIYFVKFLQYNLGHVKYIHKIGLPVCIIFLLNLSMLFNFVQNGRPLLNLSAFEVILRFWTWFYWIVLVNFVQNGHPLINLSVLPLYYVSELDITLSYFILLLAYKSTLFLWKVNASK